MKYIGCVLLFAIAVGIGITSPSQGGDNGSGFYGGQKHHYNRNRCATDFWGRCTYVARNRYAYRWRYYRPKYRRHRQRHGNDTYHSSYYPGSRERIDHGLQCHSRRRVIGEEKSNRARAQRAADNAWMGSVRYDHGERYQDMNYAKDVRHNCGPSSTTTILKRTFFRCSVEATPCRAPLGETTRVERKYEDDTPDEDDR